MEYKIVPYAEIPAPEWDRFCEQAPGAWFFHTTRWIGYTAQMKFDQSSENLSFAVTDGHRILAIVPLIAENHGDVRWLYFAGLNTPHPAFLPILHEGERFPVEKFVYETVRQMDIPYSCFFVPPLVPEIVNRSMTLNPLPRHGFQDTSISTNILRLGADEETTYRSFRKGCKSDIKTAQKRGYTVRLLHSANYDPALFDCYRRIHREAAGRQTRPDATWDAQREWVESGHSILALAWKDDRPVSAAFVNTYKQGAYYQSGATLPDFQGEVGVGHLLQWEIIRHLLGNGFTHYELGWNYSPNLSQEIADPKLLGISRFKAGFGGELYPLYRGEYFRDLEYMRKIYSERIDRLAQVRSQMQAAVQPVSSAEGAAVPPPSPAA